jgi:hypothetical protein
MKLNYYGLPRRHPDGRFKPTGHQAAALALVEHRALDLDPLHGHLVADHAADQPSPDHGLYVQRWNALRDRKY